MDANHNDTKVQALFLSDSHFHVRRTADEEERLRQFVAIVDQHTGVRDLVLLGDIFDFWFDYPHFYMKGYEDLLAGLDRAHAAGSRLHFVGGNHDIWAATFLHERYGTAPAAGPVTLDFDGYRVHCIHGDGLLGRDILYQAFRSLVRHPLGIFLGKSLHPEVLFALSSWLSGHSRQSTRDESDGIEAKARRWLARQGDAPWDHLLMGHVHHPYTTSRGDRQLTSLGGWLDHLNYGVWENGALHQRSWSPADEEGEPIDTARPPGE